MNRGNENEEMIVAVKECVSVTYLRFTTPEFSAVGVDYDPLRSFATNLGSVVRILRV